MDVLIVETDQLIGTMLAEALAEDGITAAVMPDEEALALPPSDAPLTVITGMNRGHQEDMAGLQTVRALRNKWPALGPYIWQPDGRLACAAMPLLPQTGFLQNQLP
jgi:DNA-binding response OmpR family regulator